MSFYNLVENLVLLSTVGQSEFLNWYVDFVNTQFLQAEAKSIREKWIFNHFEKTLIARKNNFSGRLDKQRSGETLFTMG